MKIQFIDVAGNTLVNNTAVDIGIRNYIFLSLFVDGEGQADAIAGDIVKNNKKIGEFAWDNTVGSTITWYTGDNRPIYVANGDKIEAVQTAPTTGRTAVTVARTQPQVDTVVSNSAFVKDIQVMSPGSTAVKRLRSTIDAINIEAPAKFRISNSGNVETIKKYLRDTLPLRDEKALILPTTSAAMSLMSTYVPPTLLDIFNNWDRIDANDYYPGGTAPPVGSNAAAWTWNDSTQSIVQPLNTATVTGFLSDEFVDYYDLDFTVKSSNADDDYNGGIIAFVREGGINYSLLISACCDGSNQGASPINDNLTIVLNGSAFTRVMGNGGNNINTGWNGQTKRLRIQRRGDIIKVNASDWNSSVINPALLMTIDLNSQPELARFKGPRQYGYFSLSQPDSTFYDIRYYGGVLRDTVIDAQTNTVYRYISPTGWTVLSDVKAQDIFSAPRILVGQGDKRYQLNKDGTIQILS